MKEKDSELQTDAEIHRRGRTWQLILAALKQLRCCWVCARGSLAGHAQKGGRSPCQAVIKEQRNAERVSCAQDLRAVGCIAAVGSF